MTYKTGNIEVPVSEQPTAVSQVPQSIEPSGGNYDALPFVIADNSNTGNGFMQMAYGGNKATTNAVDTEVRMLRLERGQKLVRRGRVIPAFVQFRSQSVITQTTGNNPFVANAGGGKTFSPGQLPDSVAPSSNNSLVRFPKTPNLL